MKIVGRHHPVHWPVHEQDNRVQMVFLTVCTNHRKRILANTEAAVLILRVWQECDAWLVGRYVMMPDHVHLFCAPRDRAIALPRWVKYWKARVSRKWPRRREQPVWQLDFWDTQLRKGESYSDKWDYVWRNPVRRGLVSRPEDWPFQGELHQFVWHDG